MGFQRTVRVELSTQGPGGVEQDVGTWGKGQGNERRTVLHMAGVG